jgi:hypothetical protein
MSSLPYFVDSGLTDGGGVSAALSLWEGFWYSFPRAIEGLEGLGQLKNPMTSSGIVPAIFRLCLLLFSSKTSSFMPLRQVKNRDKIAVPSIITSRFTVIRKYVSGNTGLE